MEERFFSSTIWPRLPPTEQALFRSQSGQMSGLPFTSVPSSPTFRSFFRVLLLHRLWLPLSLSSHTCRCGRLLDFFGHHCAASAVRGVKVSWVLDRDDLPIDAGGRCRWLPPLRVQVNRAVNVQRRVVPLSSRPAS